MPTTQRTCIGLMPIVAGPPSSSSSSSASEGVAAWPEHGPSLEALVKLTDVATVVLGPGLIAIVALSLLMVRLGSFDLALLWDHAPPVAR